MEITTIISECVNFGSVILALESNLFTPFELLEWLTLQTVSYRTLVAYKIVSESIHPNLQYMADSYHFLTKKIEYIAIALTMKIDRLLKANNNPLCTEYLNVHIKEAIIENRRLMNDERKLQEKVIIGGTLIDHDTDELLIIAYLSRKYPYVKNLTNIRRNTLLASTDWVASFSYDEDLAPIVLERLKQLKFLAPKYYEQIALPVYLPVITKLNKDKLLTKLSQETLILLDNIFTNIVDKRLLTYSTLTYRIGLMSNELAGYVLGFPIDIMIPNDEQIYSCLDKIETDGMNNYIESVKNTSLTYTTPLNFGLPIISNDEDVFSENINNYLPFDIVTFIKGDKIFRFTRLEFNNLLKTKKNHWTNEWLPESILGTITGKILATEELNLPSCRTIKNTLESIVNNTFREDKTSKYTEFGQESNGSDEILNSFAVMSTFLSESENISEQSMNTIEEFFTQANPTSNSILSHLRGFEIFVDEFHNEQTNDIRELDRTSIGLMRSFTGGDGVTITIINR